MREYKGTYQYIKKQTITELIKTILLFAMALGIFFIGYLTLGTKKSLWSIFAVLGLLPASKSLVGLLMLLRFRSLSSDIYRSLKEACGNLIPLYENIITTTQKTYFLPVILYANSNLIAYCENSKDSNKTLSKHIEDVLKRSGHKGITVKIFDEREDFVKRASEMNSNFNSDEVNPNAVYSTIKAVSL